MQPPERVSQALGAGQKVFGENRVQEAQTRWGEDFAAHREALTLHLIGPLQTNKVAQACRLFDVIQTLDREKLAKALAREFSKSGQARRLYIQVNTGEEPQKAGVLPAELDGFIQRLNRDYDLHPEGLMCIPPVYEAPSAHFWLLRELAHRNGLEKLSMGMSGDYEIAAALGASSVRVGSSLFGPRVPIA